MGTVLVAWSTVWVVMAEVRCELESWRGAYQLKVILIEVHELRNMITNVSSSMPSLMVILIPSDPVHLSQPIKYTHSLAIIKPLSQPKLPILIKYYHIINKRQIQGPFSVCQISSLQLCHATPLPLAMSALSNSGHENIKLRVKKTAVISHSQDNNSTRLPSILRAHNARLHLWIKNGN
jgi:hypothetical protein